MITREQLLKPIPARTDAKIDIPELGLKGVRVRQLTISQKTKLISMWARKSDDNLANLPARWITTCLVDDDGKRLLSSEDMGLVGSWPAPMADRIYNEILEVNSHLGTTENDDLEKKSNSSDVPPSD